MMYNFFFLLTDVTNSFTTESQKTAENTVDYEFTTRPNEITVQNVMGRGSFKLITNTSKAFAFLKNLFHIVVDVIVIIVTLVVVAVLLLALLMFLLCNSLLAL